jgi:general secretion pathway protein D
LALLTAILLSSWSGGAFAQDTRALIRVAAQDVGPGRVSVTLDFDQLAPAAQIRGNDTNRIVVTLQATGRGPTANFDAAGSALLQDILFKQESGSLELTFVLAARTRMEVMPETPRRFAIRLDALERPRARAGGASGNAADGASARADGYAGNRPLPRAAEPAPGEDSYELILLKYADVSEIAGLLSEGVTVNSNNSFAPREPGFGSPGSNNSSYTPPLQNQNNPDDRPLGEPVDSSIAIDRRLNAVWVRGSPGQVARLRAQIEAIDIPVPSVFFETQFVELTEVGARSIGLDFSNANGQIGAATIQSGQFVPQGYFFDRPGQLDSVSIQAALYAQIQRGEGRIVSKPKIAAQSGATASIITGDALPILTAITLSGVNGVSEQVQYVNVGVTLQIAPRVSSDGFVTSHVFCVVSSVTGYSQGYPTISQRQASTSITVRGGETFVIGGLVQENELKSEIRIPLLGAIPVLGRAFRLDRTTRANTELYIVITPHIIWPRQSE